MSNHRAIFLDRDGTLIEEVGYLHRPEECRLFPWTAEALRLIESAGWKAILITNQAGVAHGYFGRKEVEEVHTFLCRQLAAQQARLDALYYCPHHSRGAIVEFALPCDCRKPNTGMLRQAAAEHDLDLSACWVIGDRHDIDVCLARNAGAHSALVLTGYGREAYETQRQNWAFPPEIVTDHLLSAVQAILSIPS